MARTHTFKGSASAGYGYAAFIEDGQLVVTEDWGREGGVLYRGPYQHAQIVMSKLRAQAPKLANSIDVYYLEEEAKKISDAPAKEETITHQFKDSRDCYGYGYFGYIENNQLVLCHEAPREGGVYFRGSYVDAVNRKYMAELKLHDRVLYDDIEKYFVKHGAEPKVPIKEKTNSPAGVLWKVKLFMTDSAIHYVLVRGLNEACVINKLFPKIPEVLTLQTYDARVIAVRSDKISVAEFEED